MTKQKGGSTQRPKASTAPLPTASNLKTCPEPKTTHAFHPVARAVFPSQLALLHLFFVSQHTPPPPLMEVDSRQSVYGLQLSFFSSAWAWGPPEAWSRTNSSPGRNPRSCSAPPTNTRQTRTEQGSWEDVFAKKGRGFRSARDGRTSFGARGWIRQ